MRKDSRNFLFDLLTTPSPSGFEEEIQKIVKARVSKFADDVQIDVHGNLIAALNPGKDLRVMFAGHCDQIGFMVTHISDQGYLCFNQIGGHDPTVVTASQVVVLTENGPVNGVIGYKPVHLVPRNERGKATELSKLWIDIGAGSREEAESMVQVSDPIVYVPQVTELGANLIAAPGCDDRVGVFVVMEALRLVAEAFAKKSKSLSLFAVSTVQEEVGLRGARTACFGIDPQVGIAVDVTHASDNPGAEAKQIGTVKLGEGPTISRGANINNTLEKLLRKTADKKKIPCQRLSSPSITGTDANPIQVSRSGVATGLIGVPNRYMHTKVEVVDLRDLEAGAKLLAETFLAMTPKTDFIPG